MSDEPIAAKPESKRWSWGCALVLAVLGSAVALWIGGCAVGNAIDASKMASVKIGMTPAEVQALLGPPITKMTMGMGVPHEYVYSYQGFGERDRIDVTFDSNFKVIRVSRYSLPPSWLRHMVG
jgi:outer membrane protein assembly factor BamE (lipoprotein component of BamABCDE complex)